MPAYHIMAKDKDKDKGIAATVTPFMPPADYIANCKWLTEAEVAVYAAEYRRTGFTSAPQGIACGGAPLPEVWPRCTRFRAAA